MQNMLKYNFLYKGKSLLNKVYKKSLIQNLHYLDTFIYSYFFKKHTKKFVLLLKKSIHLYK